jgi:hypothetical protein
LGYCKKKDMESHINSRSELWKLLPNKPVIAECGVAEGLFAQEMYSWGPSRLYLVDIWESMPVYPGDAGSPQEWHNSNYDNVARFFLDLPEVDILRGPSVRMAQHVKDGSCDLVYIDACHSYDCVKADIEAWAPKVKPGGIIAFHDFLNESYGVQAAVREYAQQAGKNVVIIPENQPCDASAYIAL